MAALTDYSRFTEIPKKKNKKTIRIFLICLSLVLIFIFSKDKFLENKTAVLSILNRDTNSTSLGEVVQSQLKDAAGSYAIAIKNLRTGERYYYNEHKIFDAASLYKLFVLPVVFQTIQSGTLKNNDILEQDIKILNEKFRIASVSAELTDGKITLPVKVALQRMITISDNYSALLLVEKIGLSKVALFLKQNNFNESKVGTKGEEPITSAYDMSLFFQKLYKEELADAVYSSEMFSILKDQRLNNKIPKYLPKNIDIAHKTGELGKLSHDAGIIFAPNNDYVMVILSETNSPVIANEKISNISKAVYDYFTK